MSGGAGPVLDIVLRGRWGLLVNKPFCCRALGVDRSPPVKEGELFWREEDLAFWREGAEKAVVRESDT